MITFFEFVFILHIIRDIIEITGNLCQALQRKSHDILFAMYLVFTIKALVQKYGEDGEHERNIPYMNTRYTANRGYIAIFTVVCDAQLQELNNQFKDEMLELLVLSSD